MILSKDYRGYIEGADISKIEPNVFFAYPSKNIISYKKTAFTRPGIKNDGNLPTGPHKIIGEYVWKDALAGELPLRCTADGKVLLKYYGVWITIFSSLSGNAVRVRFAKWIDTNSAIIRNRLFFVDGSDKVFVWNGGVAVVASVATNQITIAGTTTIEALGFDPVGGGGSLITAVKIARFTNGALVGVDDNSYTAESGSVFTMNSNPSPVPNAGDLVISGVYTSTTTLAGIPKDDLYNFANHLGIASLNRVRVYFSDITSLLDYTVPVPASATVGTPFFVDLPGNYTAMISRYNQSTQQTTLWISCADSWTKITELSAANSLGYFYDSASVDASEHLGAYPFAVAQFKGDLIYLAQDNTLQQVTTVDILAKDTFKLLSDDVEGLLNRLAPKDKTTVRIYFLKRYIYIVYQTGSTLVMLDIIEGFWQPPQTIPLSHISIIGGVQYGHSNVRDETFQLFTGRNDLGAPIESVFAFGYYQGYQRISRTTHVTQDFFLKQYTKLAVSCRMTKFTGATVQQFFENTGAKVLPSFDIDGRTVKMYQLSPDESWGANPWGNASIGGADEPESDPNNPVNNLSQGTLPPSDLGKVYAWTKVLPVTFFEHRIIITAYPVGDENIDQEFHLIGWYMDDQMSDRIIDPALFIPVKGS